MDPRKLIITDYTYHLPNDRIASYPKAERDTSKLLLFRSKEITEDVFSNISGYLPAGSLMIFNNTRVIEARILFQKPTGARIEIFCLEPATGPADIGHALNSSGNILWKCLVGNAAAWSAGIILEKKITLHAPLILRAELVSSQQDYFLVMLSWEPASLTFAEVLHIAGIVPLPPYIKRKPEPSDSERYQTIFAQSSGSVAAPTAGLHFTSNILQQLTKKNIKQDFVTLHVGAGTFKPVKSATMSGHAMHAELIEIDKSLIEDLINHLPGNVIAVGTTSLRTLETLYWVGRKLLQNPTLTLSQLDVEQWEPYEDEEEIPVLPILNAVLQWMNALNVSLLVIRTSLLIAPGYKFKIADILITNFHQPRSTLLLLVAAFIGEEWKSVYSYALDHDFMFLSYGDACLFFRQQSLPLLQAAQ